MLLLEASGTALNSGPHVGGFYICLLQGVCIAGQSDLVCLHYIVCSYNIGYACYVMKIKFVSAMRQVKVNLVSVRAFAFHSFIPSFIHARFLNPRAGYNGKCRAHTFFIASLIICKFCTVRV